MEEKLPLIAKDIFLILDKARKVLSGVHFDKYHLPHVLPVALYASIFELSYSCNVLIENRLLSGVPFILRGMIEALANMKMITVDALFISKMEKEYHCQRIMNVRCLSNMSISEDDRILLAKSMAESGSVLERIALNDTGDNGKASRIGEYIGPHYSVLYRILCSEAHSDLQALEDRHLVKNGDDFEVQCFKEVPFDHCRRIVGAVLDVLLMSTDIVSRVATSFDKNSIKNMRWRAGKVMRTYFGEEL